MKGRPSLFTQEMVDDICEKLASGRSLNSICTDDKMPCIASVLAWLAKAEKPEATELHKDFLDKYLRAREAQADVIFDECLDIIDSATVEDIAVKKERVNTRMRMAGKLKPKKYGDKLNIGGQDDSPIQFRMEPKFGDL